MKKNIIMIIIGIALLFCSGVGLREAFGIEAALYYDGNTKEFTYSNLNSSDLFDEFKDLIPGDTRSQNIKIKARNIDTDIKLYLKLNKDINKSLLKYINVYYYANGILLSENDDTVLIQNFSNDSDIDLKIVVEVPIEVGNEIAGLSHYMAWTFLVEENEKPVAGTPDTGEKNAMMDILCKNSLLIVLFVAGMGIFVYGVLNTYKKQKNS